LGDEQKMNAPFSMHTRWIFHNAIEQQSRTLMRIKANWNLVAVHHPWHLRLLRRTIWSDLYTRCDHWRLGSDPRAAMRSLHHKPFVMC
jgi:hypothetical protein